MQIQQKVNTINIIQSVILSMKKLKVLSVNWLSLDMIKKKKEEKLFELIPCIDLTENYTKNS